MPGLLRGRGPGVAIGGVAIAIATVLPVGWYEHLPANPEYPPPMFNGAWLFKVCLGVTGALLALAAAKLPPIPRHPPGWLTARAEEEGDVGARAAGWILLAITLAALGLRVYHLSADLWLDEITPLQDYGGLSPLEIVATYHSSNNHLLNTLLVHLIGGTIGVREWSVRLPAVLFGVLSVPCLYWMARPWISRSAGLAAAGLLAISYHHIFFSQNARGYTAFLFFSLLSTGFLLRALRRDRTADWVLLALASFFNLFSHLLAGFVLASHAVIVLVTALRSRRIEAPVRSLLVRGGLALLGGGLLGLLLYSIAIPQVVVVLTGTYTTPVSGFQGLSLELVMEFVRGIAEGFGPGLWLGAVPFLTLAGLGFLVLWRRAWPLALGLLLPEGLIAAVFLAGGLTLAPRFFLLGLPLAFLAVSTGLWEAAGGVVRRMGWSSGRVGLTTAVTLAIAGAVGASLPWYYATPKQPYRAALAHVEAIRRPGDVVVAIHLTERGVRYYGASQGEGAYRFVRTVEAFDRVLAGNPRRTILITTFERALDVEVPDLAKRVRAGWRVESDYAATVGHGDIRIWLPSEGAAEAPRS